jgi:predicted dithiol-disulfide oxidoreductase (DUF899 family)
LYSELLQASSVNRQISHRLNNPAIVSRDEWLAARKDLLAKEKELTKTRDALRQARGAMPWLKIEKNYIFEGPAGQVTLVDLFKGRNQLFVYHLMFGPDWDEPCQRCSFNMDHVDGALIHLGQRDVTFSAVSKAPFAKIEPFKKRMGWRFNWVSSYGNDFNRDYGVSFTKEELEQGVYYNFGTTISGQAHFRSMKLLGSVCFTRVPLGFITLTPPMLAVRKPSSAPTTTSTSSLKVATKIT